MPSSSGIDRLDLLLFVALMLVTGIGVNVYLADWHVPAEDAAILMRYAEHLAQGHGIVWNIGEKPVDGATDFLYMVVVAGVAKAGVPVESAARLVSLIAHLLTVALVYLGIRQLHGSSRWLALASAAYLAAGPGAAYIATGFGTPFFALFACGTWYWATRLSQGDKRPLAAGMFAVFGLFMGLTRPEGVLFAIFMLVAVTYMLGFRQSRGIILRFVAIFVLLGGTYFLWRWAYFGHPLPNPYYVKGREVLYLYSLSLSIRYVALLLLPFIPVLAAGYVFWAPDVVRRTTFLLIPVLAFTAVWIFLANTMNYYMRFQYPILPLVLLSWPPLFEQLLRQIQWRRHLDSGVPWHARLAIVAALFALGGAYYLYALHGRFGNNSRDSRYNVGMLLSAYADKDYTIAASEAGLIPFYSRWRSIDVLGLNDQWVAHNGAITADYLARQKPHVIMFHAPFSPVSSGRPDRSLWPMAHTCQRYAEENGYILAAAYGIATYKNHYYYVRPDFPDSEELIRKIRAMDYFWPGVPVSTTNFGALDAVAD